MEFRVRGSMGVETCKLFDSFLFHELRICGSVGLEVRLCACCGYTLNPKP